ncbi:MAG: EamA/RhaT family transporter, partial [Paracoccaceae bacterium]
MTIGMALFAFADTMAKVLLENYPALQVVFVRQLGLFTGVTLFMFFTKSWVGKTSHLKLQLL